MHLPVETLPFYGRLERMKPKEKKFNFIPRFSRRRRPNSLKQTEQP
jgi:hypothetical protein